MSNRPSSSSKSERSTRTGGRRGLKNAVGPAVRRLRVERGWTQEELAAKLQVRGWSRCTRGWLSRIEARLVAVRDYELLYLRSLLGVSLEALYPSVDPVRSDPSRAAPTQR